MEIPTSADSKCLTCALIKNCPRPRNLEERNKMFNCNYFIDKSFPPEKALILTMNINRHKKPQKEISKETMSLVSEILEKNENQTRGVLKTFCASCNEEMDKLMTPNHVFYRCPNFPKCDINADPKLVSMAVLEDEVQQHEFASTYSVYRYDDALNHVNVSFEKK